MTDKSLAAAARDLRRAAPGLDKKLSAALKQAGAIVATEAALIIGFYSSRIPGSIRVVARRLNVLVRAGSAAAPHAAPFEHKGAPGAFRHPVFGNYDTWVSQKAHPYLAPALLKEQGKFDNEAIKAASAVLRDAGFH